MQIFKHFNFQSSEIFCMYFVNLKFSGLALDLIAGSLLFLLLHLVWLKKECWYKDTLGFSGCVIEGWYQRGVRELVWWG